MDTSETYIKMCDCPEIQNQKQYTYRVDSINLPWYDSSGNCWFNDSRDKTIWLPRQDQLQEMVRPSVLPNDSVSTWMIILADFIEFIDEPINAGSMEQLWLAFVMLQLYHKKWVNEEWI